MQRKKKGIEEMIDRLDDLLEEQEKYGEQKPHVSLTEEDYGRMDHESIERSMMRYIETCMSTSGSYLTGNEFYNMFPTFYKKIGEASVQSKKELKRRMMKHLREWEWTEEDFYQLYGERVGRQKDRLHYVTSDIKKDVIVSREDERVVKDICCDLFSIHLAYRLQIGKNEDDAIIESLPLFFSLFEKPHVNVQVGSYFALMKRVESPSLRAHTTFSCKQEIRTWYQQNNHTFLSTKDTHFEKFVDYAYVLSHEQRERMIDRYVRAIERDLQTWTNWAKARTSYSESLYKRCVRAKEKLTLIRQMKTK